MSDRNDAVVSRLNQLERSNRRLKVVGLAAFAVIAMGATQNNSSVPDVIKAQRFQLVDNKGNVVADLGRFGSKKHAGLVIYDSKGVLRASIGIDGESDNSGVAAYDHKGTLRAGSSMTETGPSKGTSGNFVYDKDGIIRGGVDVDQVNNFTGLFNLDTNGKTRVVSGTGLDGSLPFFNLYDVNQTLRAAMSVDFDSTGGEGMFLWDKDGVVRMIMSIDDTNLAGTGNETLLFANDNFHNNVDNSFVGGFHSERGSGGNFFTNDTNGNQTGSLPPNP